MIDDLLLPGVSPSYVKGRLGTSPGNELSSGKLASPESSASLAVNTFAWFRSRPEEFPIFREAGKCGAATQVDIEFEARFPWRGGTHPWLDACIVTNTHLIGVESKRYEPFRDKKAVVFSQAYFRQPWGAGMDVFEEVRDELSAGTLQYRHLDASQLCKHALGLFATAARMKKKPILMYLYAEPTLEKPRLVSKSEVDRHREEVGDFASRCRGAAVRFGAVSYRDWMSSWPTGDSELAAHGQRLAERFNP